jgi:N-acetylmuramoyl-L-alanine amidase
MRGPTRTVPNPHLTRRRLLGSGLLAAGAVWLDPAARAAEALAASGSAPHATSAAIGLPAMRRIGPLTAPGRGFNLAALRWSGLETTHIELRVRRGRGRWTTWRPVATSHGHGDPSDRHHGPQVSRSEPLWIGAAAADEIELRMSRPLRNLTLHTVRVTPAARPIVAARAAQAAPGLPPLPPIVTRQQWGADALAVTQTPAIGTVQAASVHHTVTGNDYSPEEAPGIVLAIGEAHRAEGDDDIGYNILVDRFGIAYEGRGGGLDQAIVGAHTIGWNSQITGIAILGTFVSEPPSAAAVDTLTQLLAWKLTVHGVPTQGTVDLVSGGLDGNLYPLGAVATLPRICGHEDCDATECPGEQLYPLLPSIRDCAAALVAAAAPVPAAAPPTV